MSAILRFARARPLAFGIGYSCAKTGGCDLLVQKVVEKRKTADIDWRRTGLFASFGFFYLGGVQYALYVPVFSRLFPNAASFAAKSVGEKLRDVKGLRDLVAQVFLDQALHHPFMYFPVFYIMKDVLTSDAPSPVRAVSSYVSNMREDCLALWKIWVPSTFINFAFMPMHLRIPWVATTSLVWTCILSAMRGGAEAPEKEVYAAVDAETLELVSRSKINPPPLIDHSRTHLLLVMRGTDQPGFVRAVTKRLYERSCTITTSKMIKLGQEFTIIMHVSCPPAELEQLRSSLCSRRLQKTVSGSYAGTSDEEGVLEGATISLKQIQPVDASPRHFCAQVWLTGADRPGLLYHLTDILAEQHLNIEHLQTELDEMAHSKRQEDVFYLSCLITSEHQPDVGKLRIGLRKIEQDHGVACSMDIVDVSRS